MQAPNWPGIFIQTPKQPNDTFKITISRFFSLPNGRRVIITMYSVSVAVCFLTGRKISKKI